MASKFHSFPYFVFIIFRYSNSLLINLTLNLFFSRLLFTFYHSICRIVCNNSSIIFYLFKYPFLHIPKFEQNTGQILKYWLKLFKNGRENAGCKVAIKKEKSIWHLVGEEGWGFLWISFLFDRFHRETRLLDWNKDKWSAKPVITRQTTFNYRIFLEPDR